MKIESMKIQEKSLQEIELLLHQSLRGVHHLFSNEEIARVMSKTTEDADLFSFENMDKVQKLFSQLVDKKTLELKQAFLERLDTESYEMLLRTYFHIVENTLMNSTEHRH